MMACDVSPVAMFLGEHGKKGGPNFDAFPWSVACPTHVGHQEGY